MKRQERFFIHLSRWNPDDARRRQHERDHAAALENAARRRREAANTTEPGTRERLKYAAVLWIGTARNKRETFGQFTRG